MSEPKFYLAFSPDRGNREDCDVYYSELIRAANREDALRIAKRKFGATYTMDDVPDDYDSGEEEYCNESIVEILEMKVVTE